MIIYRFYDKSCKGSLTCFSSLLDSLETATGLILQNKNPDKIVNGSLSVWHLDHGHLLRIEIYEKNETSNMNHSANFKKVGRNEKKKVKEALDKIGRAGITDDKLLERFIKMDDMQAEALR